MAKKKKGLLAQAKAYLRANYLALGTSRYSAKKDGLTDRIHSIETYEKYAKNIELSAKYLGVSYIKQISPDLALTYLQDRQQAGIGQKQLDSDRRALSLMINEPLNKVTALNPVEKKSRAYTSDQVAEIISHQKPRNALATCIALDAGLRGRELFTLRPVGVGKPKTSSREFNQKRFLNRPAGTKYLVTGKGGLVREVQISNILAEQLEQQRFKNPRLVNDRNIKGITQYYNLGGGNNWASAFSQISTKVLGWSHGGHGLRHSYAQKRMKALQSIGFNYYTAREIVAQEMGHFRGSITETYLR